MTVLLLVIASPRFALLPLVPVVLQLFSELDYHGGVDPLECFSIFFKKLASVLEPTLSTVFRVLLRLSLFPSQWCCADVVPIPKEATSFLLCGFRPISNTLVLSKVYERLASFRLRVVMENEGVFSRHQYAYRKGLETCVTILDILCVVQAAF